jgi:hypothetical protein
MTCSRNTHILMLAISLLLGSLPAAAVAYPFSLRGTGHVTFTVGNTPTGGNLTASGTATHLGQGTAIGVLSFSAGPESHLIMASGQQTFTAANSDELHVEFEDAVLGTTTGIATGVFLFLGGTDRFEEARSRWPMGQNCTAWRGLGPHQRVSGGQIFSRRTKWPVNRAATALRLAASCLPHRQSA